MFESYVLSQFSSKKKNHHNNSSIDKSLEIYRMSDKGLQFDPKMIQYISKMYIKKTNILEN